MKNTKKKLLVFLVLALTISLAGFTVGCRSSGDSQSQPAIMEQKETPAVGAPDEIGSENNPIIVLTPRIGIRNSDIKVSGNGFLPGENVAIILNGKQGSRDLLAVNVDKTGVLEETTVKLPEGLEIGEYLIAATGEQSGLVVEEKFRIRQEGATIDLDKYTGRPGLPLGIKGIGFAPGERVLVFFEDASDMTMGEIQADELGRIDVQDLKLPFVKEGSHNLIIQGEDSKIKLDRSFLMYGFHPWVVLEPYALAPGSSMDLSGNGFIPGETVRVFLDSTNEDPFLSLEADWEGKVFYRGAFMAETSHIGQHSLIIIGSNSNEETSHSFQVMQFFPNIDLLPYAGPPGTKVTINGQGFAPGETIRVFLGEGTQKREVTSFQADKDGYVRGTGDLTIDYGARKGDVMVTAAGDASRASVARGFAVLTGDPWISLSDYAGIEGKQITIKGGGFGANESISIMVGSENVGTATADASGAFQGTNPVIVPSGSGSTVVFIVKGDKTGGRASATYTVTP